MCLIPGNLEIPDIQAGPGGPDGQVIPDIAASPGLDFQGIVVIPGSAGGLAIPEQMERRDIAE